MAIPTDEEMVKFKTQLEEWGVALVQTKLNQNIFAPDSWKVKEINTFLENKIHESQAQYQNTLIKLQKERNQIAWVALIISIIAICLSVYNLV